MEGIGLAMGIERLAYIVKTVVDPKLPTGIDLYVMGMTEDIVAKNFTLADMLRSSGFVVETNYAVKSMPALLKTALRKNAKFAIIIGEDEIAKKEVAVKNLKTQDQTYVKLEDLENVLHTLFNEYYANEMKLEGKEE